MDNNLIYNKKSLLDNINLIIDENAPLISNLSNISRLIFETMDGTSWCGFYLVDEDTDTLYLGPYQGPIACTRIPFGKGVCGQSLSKMTTELVPNVHEYPGHIACSDLTNSEIVVPLVYNNKCLGVLDLDSTKFANFSKEDAALLEDACKIIVKLFK